MSGEVYQDLEEFDFGKEMAALTEENNVLSEELRVLMMEHNALLEQLPVKEKLKEKLLTNISSLYKTTKLELSRKDRTIQDLKMVLDNLIFRRGNENKTSVPHSVNFKKEFTSVGNNSQSGNTKDALFNQHNRNMFTERRYNESRRALPGYGSTEHLPSQWSDSRKAGDRRSENNHAANYENSIFERDKMKVNGDRNMLRRDNMNEKYVTKRNKTNEYVNKNNGFVPVKDNMKESGRNGGSYLVNKRDNSDDGIVSRKKSSKENDACVSEKGKIKVGERNGECCFSGRNAVKKNHERSKRNKYYKMTDDRMFREDVRKTSERMKKDTVKEYNECNKEYVMQKNEVCDMRDIYSAHALIANNEMASLSSRNSVVKKDECIDVISEPKLRKYDQVLESKMDDEFDDTMKNLMCNQVKVYSDDEMESPIKEESKEWIDDCIKRSDFEPADKKYSEVEDGELASESEEEEINKKDIVKEVNVHKKMPCSRVIKSKSREVESDIRDWKDERNEEKDDCDVNKMTARKKIEDDGRTLTVGKKNERSSGNRECRSKTRETKEMHSENKERSSKSKKNVRNENEFMINEGIGKTTKKRHRSRSRDTKSKKDCRENLIRDSSSEMIPNKHKSREFKDEKQGSLKRSADRDFGNRPFDQNRSKSRDSRDKRYFEENRSESRESNDTRSGMVVESRRFDQLRSKSRESRDKGSKHFDQNRSKGREFQETMNGRDKRNKQFDLKRLEWGDIRDKNIRGRLESKNTNYRFKNDGKSQGCGLRNSLLDREFKNENCRFNSLNHNGIVRNSSVKMSRLERKIQRKKERYQQRKHNNYESFMKADNERNQVKIFQRHAESTSLENALSNEFNEEWIKYEEELDEKHNEPPRLLKRQSDEYKNIVLFHEKIKKDCQKLEQKMDDDTDLSMNESTDFERLFSPGQDIIQQPNTPERNEAVRLFNTIPGPHTPKQRISRVTGLKTPEESFKMRPKTLDLVHTTNSVLNDHSLQSRKKKEIENDAMKRKRVSFDTYKKKKAGLIAEDKGEANEKMCGDTEDGMILKNSNEKGIENDVIQSDENIKEVSVTTNFNDVYIQGTETLRKIDERKVLSEESVKDKISYKNESGICETFKEMACESQKLDGFKMSPNEEVEVGNSLTSGVENVRSNEEIRTENKEDNLEGRTEIFVQSDLKELNAQVADDKNDERDKSKKQNCSPGNSPISVEKNDDDTKSLSVETRIVQNSCNGVSPPVVASNDIPNDEKTSLVENMPAKVSPKSCTIVTGNTIHFVRRRRVAIIKKA